MNRRLAMARDPLGMLPLTITNHRRPPLRSAFTWSQGIAKDSQARSVDSSRRAFLFRPRLGCTSCAHDNCKQ